MCPTEQRVQESPSADAFLLVLNTCPDRDCAQRIAERLVRDRLAACVTILPQVHSIYEWQGEVQQESECQLIIKTRRARFAQLCQALRAQHPYELPEIIALPIVDGLPAYLDWIAKQTEPPA